MKHIVSFSGGKDSTAMLLRMIELKMQIDDIVFADTGLEFNELLEYVSKVEKYINRKITIVKPEHNWDWHFYRKKQKGNNIGEIYGYPVLIGAWCNDRLKMQPLNKWLKKQGNHYIYLGIASDEPNRLLRLKDNAKTPLVDWGWNEEDALNYLKRKNLVNPLYHKFKRLGCYLCPKQSKRSLRVLYNEYPDKWQKMKEYEKDSPVSFKPNKTLLDFEKEFKAENLQTKLF